MINITSIEYLPSSREVNLKRRISHTSKGCYLHQKGYISICAGPFRGKYLHQLIWQWTHPNETYDSTIHDIHHIDGDPTNFHPGNLERVSHRHHYRHTQLAGRLLCDPESKQFRSGRINKPANPSNHPDPHDEVPF